MSKLIRQLLLIAGASLMLASVSYAYDCSSVAQYVDGSSYATGAVVQNNDHAYQCTVGGWCTVGGPYAPGAGWAWTSAWSDLGACGGNNPPPSSGNPPPSSGNPPPSSGNPPPSSGNPPPSSGNGGGAAAWNASSVYTGGDEVCYKGILYSANWWTQGDEPDQSGPWGPWKKIGTCSGGGNPPPSSGNPPPSSGNPPPSSGNPPPSSGGGNPTPVTGTLFSPYKDIGVNMNWNTYMLGTKVTGSQEDILDVLPSGMNALSLAFATGECGSETWAGVKPAQLVSGSLQALDAAGINYVISTGGANGAFSCSSPSAFLDFISTYYTPHMIGVDFDMEGGQNDALINNIIAGIKAAQAQYPNMRFSFTLATFGTTDSWGGPALGALGQKVMADIKAAGLTDYYINLMAMDYGAANPNECVVVDGACDMGQSAIASAKDLHNRFGVPYDHIGVTPMIGRNDVADEIFTLEDADELAAWAEQVGLGGVHYWSFDRDTDCTNAHSSATCNSWPHAGVLGFANRFIADGL